MQGIARKFSRFDRFDYAWPMFAHIGEQAVLNKELYYTASDTLNDDTFGYIPRYSEYRFENNRVSGYFSTTLDYWHLARKFGNRPSLNADFIYPVPEQNNFGRIFAVQDFMLDNIYAHILNIVKVRRKLPKFGTPLL